MSKRLITLIITAVICFALVMPASAADDIRVYVNERELEFDVPPMIENDRTLVPLRVIFEALGADVKWDEQTQTVTASKDLKTIQLQIDDTKMDVSGNIILLDVPAKLYNDRTLVPIRAVSEAFDAVVCWDEETMSVHIIMPAQTEPATSEGEQYIEDDVGDDLPTVSDHTK